MFSNNFDHNDAFLREKLREAHHTPTLTTPKTQERHPNQPEPRETHKPNSR